MDSLMCAVENWLQWTTVVANIATVIASLSIVASIACYAKNIFSKKNFRTTLFLTAFNTTVQNNTAIYFNLIFKNFINKDVSVISVSIKCNDKIYPVFKSSSDINDLRPDDLLTNLPVPPYRSETFGGLIVVSRKDFLPDLPIKIIVETTRKTITTKETLHLMANNINT